MPGVSRHTGAPLTRSQHIDQSVVDILTTPIGTRVGRRDYGSRLMAIIDGPIGPGLTADVAQASVEALDRWEPRYTVRQVALSGRGPDGQVLLEIDGIDPDGASLLVGVAL